jgi:hypothetical protein
MQMADTNSSAVPDKPFPLPNPALKHLAVLIGEWTVEVVFPLAPGETVRGQATFEWLEGGCFLAQRSSADHPDAPSGLLVTGCDDTTGRCTTLYYDSRGVSRIYETSLRDGVWKQWRDAPGFAQRFTGTLADDGNTIDGTWELSQDGQTWEPDFTGTYRRVR